MSKSFRRKLQLARQFSLTDWLVLVEAWWLLLFFNLALRGMSCSRFNNPERSTSEKAPRPLSNLRYAQALHELVGYASQCHLIQMSCLVQSLTLQKILNERDIPAQVMIGVRKMQNAFFAHAWVEANGTPVGEADDLYQKFNKLESSAKLNQHQFNSRAFQRSNG